MTLNTTTVLWTNGGENISDGYYQRYVSCKHNDMYLPRILTTVMTVGIILENTLLLVAITAHWKKFHSNLYRFVASLVCADLFVGLSNFVVLMVKITNAELELVSFLKGASYTSFLMATLSLTLLNLSVKSTYTRSYETFVQMHSKHKYSSRLNSILSVFRKKSHVRKMVIGIWLVLPIFIAIAMFTRCTAEEHDCTNGCATIIMDSNGDEQTLCNSQPYCSRFMAPLGSPFILLVNGMSWFCFVTLIASTISVVCVKVVLTSSTPAKQITTISTNSTSVEGDTKTPVSELQVPGTSRSLMYDEGDDLSIGPMVVAKRRFGCNKDFVSKFSLAVTSLQMIFWVPVTALTLRGYILQTSYTKYYTLEMINNVFFVPSLLNPWICIFTMSKLRDAIRTAYIERRLRNKITRNHSTTGD
ncbi:uncharacterized protein LOC120340995 isoform X1 [Styela clava]